MAARSASRASAKLAFAARFVNVGGVMTDRTYDVAIVGASIAGSAAATLFARRGLRVALIERAPDVAAYKTACTHYIQPSATAAIERLGLAERLDQRGAVRNSIDLWTRYGWARHPDDLPHGYSMRRQTLDPIVRQLAAHTPGVDLMLGHRVTELLEDDGRVAGVRATTPDGRELSVRPRFVVAADGRSSHLAKEARVPTRTWPNRRFAYWAYFGHLPLRTGSTAQLWFLDPRVAYAFPNEDDVTLVVFWGHKRELGDFKGDIDGAVRSRWAEIPDAPRLEDGEQLTSWLGQRDVPNVRRPAAHRGMALIGDAAQASDPVWGVGCGWAFQSAEWLVESTADALLGEHGLEPALAAYRRRHRRELMLHHLVISEYSRGRRFMIPEKLTFAAAARDPAVARHIHSYAARLIPVSKFLSPVAGARTLRALMRRRPDGQPAPRAAAPQREHSSIS